MRNPLRLPLAASAAALALLAPAAAHADTPPTPVAPAAGSCAHPDDATKADVRYRWSSRRTAWRVRPALVRVAARSRAGAGAINGSITSTTQHTGIEAWYLVLDARQVGDTCWLHVRTPGTLASRGGWVDRDLVIAQRLAWQLEVDLSDRRVRMFRGARKVLDRPVVIGATATPTPRSRSGEPFAIYDAKAGRASDFTGTWQLATNVLSPSQPTMGRIGLHGRGGASLATPLGSAASHGCVRADNATVGAIVRQAGLRGLLGVPVVISA
jgi:hypothetical protein